MTVPMFGHYRGENNGTGVKKIGTYRIGSDIHS